MTDKNYFIELYEEDVSAYVEKKNGLNYVSWAYAWKGIKEKHPTATYTIYENPDGWNYFTDGRTCWVKTGVTIDGLEHIEYLPVMDYRNKAIPLERVTSFDVNTAIQRSLTKACARHGYGLKVYAGEDVEAATKESQGPMTDAQREELVSLGVDLEQLCTYFKVKTCEDITESMARIAIDAKKRKLAQETSNE
jgi:hypothetical protein